MKNPHHAYCYSNNQQEVNKHRKFVFFTILKMEGAQHEVAEYFAVGSFNCIRFRLFAMNFSYYAKRKYRYYIPFNKPTTKMK